MTEKINDPLNSTAVRKIRGFRCDQCGCQMTHGREIVLNDKLWTKVVRRSKSPWPVHSTLLCPECIQKLLGREIVLEDLTSIWTKRGKNLVPMNYWYIKKSGLLSKALPWIIKDYRIGNINVWVQSSRKAQEFKD